jgi:hypothetical protein
VALERTATAGVGAEDRLHELGRQLGAFDQLARRLSARCQLGQVAGVEAAKKGGQLGGDGGVLEHQPVGRGSDREARRHGHPGARQAAGQLAERSVFAAYDGHVAKAEGRERPHQIGRPRPRRRGRGNGFERGVPHRRHGSSWFRVLPWPAS